MSELRIGLIGGSGLGEALIASGAGKRHEIQTPFGQPSDAIIETVWNGITVFGLARHGAGHTLNPTKVPYRANLFALKQLGCTHIIASGAVGSLREEFKPRDLVIPDQLIDRTAGRTSTFFERAAVHVEFAEPFCPQMRQILIEAGEGSGSSSDEATERRSDEGRDGADGSEVQDPAGSAAPPSSLNPEPRTLNPPVKPEPFLVHDRGCYVCMEGPAFSTRAESLMHRLCGGDLIGMTALPEAKLARECEISYGLIALVTDYDCWRARPADAASEHKADPSLLLKEIIGNLQAATANALALMRRAVDLMSQRGNELMDAPSHHALQLAIWSKKPQIDPEEVRRLWPLWGRYFKEEEPEV